MVGIGEIELHACLLLNDGIRMELGAVVGSDRCEPEAVLSNQVNDSLIGLLLGAAFELVDQHVSRFAFYQGDKCSDCSHHPSRYQFPSVL